MDPHIRLDRRQVPCHWHVVPSEEGFRFRHRERCITVEAVETGGVNPDFLDRWQLQYRQRCNEAESCRSVGRVTTETEALEALFSWMERINAAGEDGSVPDITALGAAAARETTQTGPQGDEPRAVRGGDGWRGPGRDLERDAQSSHSHRMVRE